MKVILLQDIRGKGKKGQMIEASDGYARNFLLPRKMAIEATADNINTMKMNDKAKAEQMAREKAQAQEFADKLKEIITIVGGKSNIQALELLAKLMEQYDGCMLGFKFKKE